METPMPFYKELASAAGSTYVRDVMVEKFKREVTVLKVDELELTKKAHAIRARVAERDLLLEELEKLFPCESWQLSVLEINILQNQDLKEAADILGLVMKKITRANFLMSFIEKLKQLPY
ncbi:hypothetical protein CTI12_AA147010 [Artemisia annua]|uniref:Uncharacterized protein n=1 Tax=Artemisia annua TaxID=35608 RepID=A0A2U1PIX2_ARTAN|nr:hypothetical protein CTI12_AA147010 [Artemisia annua]